VFRLVQECLTNIHRHAESPDAVIRVTKTGSSLAVDVSDHGRGMPSQTENESGDSCDLFGVGITGMRERVEQLGGHMEIQSGPRGYVLKSDADQNLIAAMEALLQHKPFLTAGVTEQLV